MTIRIINLRVLSNNVKSQDNLTILHVVFFYPRHVKQYFFLSADCFACTYLD